MATEEALTIPMREHLLLLKSRIDQDMQTVKRLQERITKSQKEFEAVNRGEDPSVIIWYDPRWKELKDQLRSRVITYFAQHSICSPLQIPNFDDCTIILRRSRHDEYQHWDWEIVFPTDRTYVAYRAVLRLNSKAIMPEFTISDEDFIDWLIENRHIQCFEILRN